MCLAIPGRITSIEGNDSLMRMARVCFGGIVKTINLACVPEARVGDWVLVHVGFALQRIDESEAEAIVSLLEETVSNPENAKE